MFSERTGIGDISDQIKVKFVTGLQHFHLINKRITVLTEGHISPKEYKERDISHPKSQKEGHILRKECRERDTSCLTST